MKKEKNKRKIFLIGIVIGIFMCATGIYAATSIYSANVTYDNTSSSLSSSTVQGAIDELYGMCKVMTLSSYITYLFGISDQIRYDSSSWSYTVSQAESVGLQKDYWGNIRYYGASPNNYVLFNDELWRIVGVFDVEDEDGNVESRVKIVRAESIGEYSFDNKSTGSASSTSSSNYGSNDWTEARLMMLLNPGYEDGATNDDGDTIYEYEGSLYWNRKSGTCYSGLNVGTGLTYSDATVSCDFTSIGLTTKARSMLDYAKYYIIYWSSGYIPYSGLLYTSERGLTDTYVNDVTEWTGYVGLLNASDIMYMNDLNVCSSSYWGITSDEECYDENWFLIYTESSFNSFFFSSTKASYRCDYFDDGANTMGSCSTEVPIYPTVYLKASVSKYSGDGTATNPYIIR